VEAPDERLLRALLLQAFYSIRSERQLMEQLDYNLLYRWFVGLGVDVPVWVPTVFTKNRDRLLEADVARKFLAELMHRPTSRNSSPTKRCGIRQDESENSLCTPMPPLRIRPAKQSTRMRLTAGPLITTERRGSLSAVNIPTNSKPSATNLLFGALKPLRNGHSR
jgi:hypothetical protein